MTPDTVIRSRQNPIYKHIRSLLRRDRRHQERAFLVEGPRFVADAIASGATPTSLVLAETFSKTNEWAAYRHRILDDELFASVSDTVASQGVIGVFPFPSIQISTGRHPLLLIADGIQDPGNLGSLIRSAAGAGATHVIALPGTTDPWGPKTVRAAAAAHFLIPITSIAFEDLHGTLPTDCHLVVADAAGTERYDAMCMTESIAIVIGSEGKGCSAGVLSLQPTFATIPLAAGLESLNAGVAGSILLFEAARQRRAMSKLPENPSF